MCHMAVKAMNQLQRIFCTTAPEMMALVTTAKKSWKIMKACSETLVPARSWLPNLEAARSTRPMTPVLVDASKLSE